MARNMYEYSTSPRKLEPDYQRKTKKRNLRVVKDLPRQDVKISKAQKERQISVVSLPEKKTEEKRPGIFTMCVTMKKAIVKWDLRQSVIPPVYRLCAEH